MGIGKEQRPDFNRGLREGRTQLPILQQKWPKGFPVEVKNVRPLVNGVIPLIAEEMGWGPVYTRGVILTWKQRMAYCKAVLHYDKRFHLDGTMSEETVNDSSRAAASDILARLAAKRAKTQEKARAAAQAPTAAAEPAIAAAKIAAGPMDAGAGNAPVHLGNGGTAAPRRRILSLPSARAGRQHGRDPSLARTNETSS